jgi:hypothetical protein
MGWRTGSNIASDGGFYDVESGPGGYPPSRVNHAMCPLRRSSFSIWVFGGLDGSGNTLSDLWSWNPTTDKWIWSSGKLAIWSMSQSLSENGAARTQ